MTALVLGLMLMQIGQGWMAEFNHSAEQMLALAEATPADKFTWRPRAGVRSVSEVYMHVALGNFGLVDQAGGKIPDDTPNIEWKYETTVTSKAEVITWLKRSFNAVRVNYPKLDMKQPRKFLGKPSTTENVFLRILVHNHEHMGQSIGYARMIGVTPPWSK